VVAFATRGAELELTSSTGNKGELNLQGLLMHVKQEIKKGLIPSCLETRKKRGTEVRAAKSRTG
jgi:hypothetical protein